MDDVQITEILESLPETACFFYGVFSSNKIPQSFYDIKNGFIIVNTINDSNESIGHWCCMIARDGVLEYYDSLQNPMTPSGEIGDFFSKYPGEKVIAFDSPLQSEESLVCGAYAIYFCYMYSLGYSRFHIKKQFTSNKRKNDMFVSNFVFKKTGTLKSCNKKYCAAYMFGFDCRSYCAC